MADRSSRRYKRGWSCEAQSSLSQEEHTQKAADMKREREDRRQKDPRRIVFFGDGRFKCTMRGNPSIPKKKLLKRLAVRTVTVLLDEHKTSQQCPCGGGKLKDFANHDVSKRVRVHKTDGGVCNVLGQVNDRDELAVVNMILAVRSALTHTAWPKHLCRTCV